MWPEIRLRGKSLFTPKSQRWCFMNFRGRFSIIETTGRWTGFQKFNFQGWDFLRRADRSDRLIQRSSRNSDSKVKNFHFPDYCKKELIVVNFYHMSKHFKAPSRRFWFARSESPSFAPVSALCGSFSRSRFCHSILSCSSCYHPITFESRRDILVLGVLALSKFLGSIIVSLRTLSYTSS
jgi:hypothetical protein